MKKTERPRIPITRPLFDQREREMIDRCLESGWVAQGPQVERFEKACAQFSGLPQAVAVSSATAGLHMVLAALGIGPGDEVIVPSFTFVATANAVEYTGAKPIFVDISLDTFNLTAQAVETAISPKTRAVVPVSLFGLAADVEAIGLCAGSRNIYIVEDAACALGAFRSGLHSGHHATAAVYSFHPRKIITTGEGGMILCQDSGLADALRQLRNHGAQPGGADSGFDLPQVTRLGYNYRMTDLQGALGVAQMEKLKRILQSRREIARTYNDLLSGQTKMILPVEPEGCVHAFQSYVALWTDGEQPALDTVEALNRARNKVFARLEKQGIGLRPGTYAIHTLDYYREKYSLSPQDHPNSFLAERLSMALPIYPGLEPEQLEFIASCIMAA